MPYNPLEVQFYAKKVCKLFNFEIIQSAPLSTWDEALQRLNKRAQELDEAKIGVHTHAARQERVAGLMVALVDALHFVDKNPNYKEHLELYMDSVLERTKQFQELASITMPQSQPVVAPANTVKKEDELKSATTFRKEPAYEKLVNYQEFLSKDTRFHSFRVKDKAETLNTLLGRLDRAQSMDDIKRELQQFYEGKGIKNSRYERLNLGQGLLSRIQGFFNSNTHTTTLELIDKLAQPLGIGNLAIPSLTSKK